MALRFYDRELLEDLSISHFAGPDPAGEGWGLKEYERRHYRIMGQRYNPAVKTLFLDMEDQRSQLRVGSWETLHNEKTSHVGFDGAARILPHSGVAYFRGSLGYIEDPSDGIIREIAAHKPLIGPNGVVLEGQSQQDIQRSSDDWTTAPWTNAGTGVNGSAIALDSTDLVFDSNIANANNSCKFTAGTAHAADMYIEQTTASLASGTIWNLSYYHKDDSGVAMDIELRRSVDNWYWNDSSGAFQSGQVWNAAPVRSAKTRDYFKPINVGGSATALRVRFGQKSGGTSGRINHLYHVQGEHNLQGSPSSVMVSGTSTFIRSGAAYSYCNDSGKRIVNNSRGTLLLRWTPSFSADEDGNQTEFCTLAYVNHEGGSSNIMFLAYAGSSGQIYLERTGNGTVASILANHTIARGTEVRLGVRWATPTGTGDGELDAPYGAAASGKHRFDLWINGAAVGSSEATNLVEAAVSQFGIGSTGDVSPNAAWGAVRHLRLLPYVLTDLEMARWMA